MSITVKPGLDTLRSKISQEAKHVGIKPFSHNIVGMYLGEIAKLYGDEEARKAIKDFGLHRKGWSLR